MNLLRNVSVHLIDSGYVYLKSLPHRDQLAKDTEDQVKLITERFVNMTMSLEWMSMTSRRKLRSKGSTPATAVLHNIGWPTELFGDFSDSSVIDAYHEEDYGPIIEAFNRNQDDFYTIKHILQAAFVNREAIRLLTQKADRKDFLMSPAMVNAWYQPDRNSLTVPAALWNSPFYK
ncbi:hypothetical protein TELCIR_18167 [Teladorsagia circumcincta]|uniref:Uncharacterized protein n=1 Tax=Teladorsagia circumcincta TaxID=45464 RepID=A0A2G9TQR0_TELCI|nr:hypothetical protein TELCIR_18167 [Teladorsagia circumcincta]